MSMLSCIIHVACSHWTDQWKKTTNNLAVLHTIVTGLALINCAWKCTCYSSKFGAMDAQESSLNTKCHTLWTACFNTGISIEWATQCRRTIITIKKAAQLEAPCLPTKQRLTGRTTPKATVGILVLEVTLFQVSYWQTSHHNHTYIHTHTIMTYRYTVLTHIDTCTYVCMYV